ncbi:MAG: hypothetical protein K2H36_05590 [Clostridia bacterium]|nr:hypothetical protein [Clostridia bacterium]
MKKKAIVITILAIMLLTMCMAMFGGCVNRKPRKVAIEIVNPLTGKVFEQDKILELPNEQTPIEVRVKDKIIRKYLTDKNLSDVTLEDSLSIKVSRLWKSNYKEVLNTEGLLPIEEENVVASNYYEIEVTFDCKPANSDEEYKRKYQETTASVCFYSDKEWKGTDYFDLVFDEWTYRDSSYSSCENPPTTPEEWGICYKDIWDDVPELREKVDTLEELNALRSKKEYPFFNEEYANDRINKAMQRLDEFDDKYFEEKSLIFVMEFRGIFFDLGKIYTKDVMMTISMVQPEMSDVILLDDPQVRVSVIEVDKQVVKGIEQIKVEEIMR